MFCKICCKDYTNFAWHLRVHGLSFIEYKVQYENFVIPSCKRCGSPAKLKSGTHFRDYCGKPECKRSGFHGQKHSDEVKESLRFKRLNWLKDNPEKTAWRLGNKMSWPEKFFMDACERAGLTNQYTIVREKSVYPYFIDFAFTESMVAVEVDGSQHLNQVEHDIRKDAKLKEKGWRVYRIPAAKLYSEENSDSVVRSFIEFLNAA